MKQLAFDASASRAKASLRRVPRLTEANGPLSPSQVKTTGGAKDRFCTARNTEEPGPTQPVSTPAVSFTATSAAVHKRRIMAVVLPDLLPELALDLSSVKSKKVDSQQLIGVVVSDQLLKESLLGTSTLSAVNALASNAGLSAAQTIAEARALCAHLNV